jgi:hypothetical protein
MLPARWPCGSRRANPVVCPMSGGKPENLGGGTPSVKRLLERILVDRHHPFRVIADGPQACRLQLQVNDLTEIGPVQLMQVGFDPGANFEGRIADELARELVVLEHQEEKMGAIVGALLGLKLDDADSPDAGSEEGAEHSFGFTRAEIEEMGASLPPGGSAGLILIEHVWARGLKRAIRDAGGRSLGESFLTPETVAAMEPKLAAISRAVRATE